MVVHVRTYFNGHHTGYEMYAHDYMYRGKYVRGIDHQRIPGNMTWDRQMATAALDLLENVYGYKRSAIRFVHH